eukprot:TRINITY_DN17855_c0_g1_i8.p1 TRINITY_DN17855_c0_g1~~TRINITY_DN17855_c0_g1_i8.p1  ORF type:complete len:198 (-),score=53.76 TRINITY_DN17855_c0_g1_i8:133-687(-)
MRQQEADTIRKLKLQHKKQLDKEVGNARESVRQECMKEVLAEQEEKFSRMQAQLQQQYQLIAEQRAALIENKVGKLESEYVTAVREHLQQLEQAQAESRSWQNQYEDCAKRLADEQQWRQRLQSELQQQQLDFTRLSAQQRADHQQQVQQLQTQTQTLQQQLAQQEIHVQHLQHRIEQLKQESG